MEALGWEGDAPARYRDTFGRFPFASRDIVE